MKAFLLFLSLFIGVAASAQQKGAEGPDASWKITWGKKTLLKTSNEDESSNVIVLKRADLKKKNTFTLTYMAPAGVKGWERSISIMDTSDNALQTNKASQIKLNNAAFAELFNGRGEIRIYTTAVPSDKRKAALVRVRRVHLATIRVQ